MSREIPIAKVLPEEKVEPELGQSKGEQLKAFLGELKPGITTPFAEFRQLSQEEREVLGQKLGELKKQEEYALATYRSIEASGLREYIKKLEARLNEHKKADTAFCFQS